MILTEFVGDCPFYLMFVEDGTPEGALPLVVDLDKPGWMAEHGDIFRSVGDLYLVRKQGDVIVLSVRLLPGEQGYYVARHIGVAIGAGYAKSETVAYGIGKKRNDGNEDNLWFLSWGQFCAGKDVEYFALEGLKKGLA